MKVKRESMFTGIVREKDLDITEEQMKLWDATRLGKCNQLVQDIFPNLSDEDREFILTGATQDEWDDMFGDDER